MRKSVREGMEDKWKPVPVYYFVSNEFPAEKVDTSIGEGEILISLTPDAKFSEASKNLKYVYKIDSTEKEEKIAHEVVEDSIALTEACTRKFKCPNLLKKIKGKVFSLSSVKACCAPVSKNGLDKFDIALEGLVGVNTVSERWKGEGELIVAFKIRHSLRNAEMTTVTLKTLTISDWGKSAKEAMQKVSSQ
eukprot:TRINITY_DN11647_c0_g1_i1.p1 TRINITY_DN11647_c0_g1~~TRINITY_DN11647_c0_g1_i1.p1  ORF type:complete len:191 (-),score=42.13 TRINITY_DN11647_c0_g1_i1:163-735(-)